MVARSSPRGFARLQPGIVQAYVLVIMTQGALNLLKSLQKRNIYLASDAPNRATTYKHFEVLLKAGLVYPLCECNGYMMLTAAGRHANT